MSWFVLSLTLSIIINEILICLMKIYLKFFYVKKCFKTEDSVLFCEDTLELCLFNARLNTPVQSPLYKGTFLP